MKEAEVLDYARQLFEAHGATAVAEAAQRAKHFEQLDDADEAATWRRIEAALKLMCGAHES